MLKRSSTVDGSHPPVRSGKTESSEEGSTLAFGDKDYHAGKIHLLLRI
ncbi:MAG: hypothetical protein RBR63_04465 [Methanosarcina vacuolata]|nr:hypothetical protein [Methanosarcina vacuolata]